MADTHKYPLSAYAYLACTLFMAAIIFTFSCQGGPASTQLSGFFSEHILNLLQGLFPAGWFKEVDPGSLEPGSLQFCIRKFAHLSEYALLGLFAFLCLRDFRVRLAPVLACAFCFLYACTDEYHQLLVGTRTGQFTDVLIDTTGAAIGIVLTLLLAYRKRKRAAADAASGMVGVVEAAAADAPAPAEGLAGRAASAEAALAPAEEAADVASASAPPEAEGRGV